MPFLIVVFQTILTPHITSEVRDDLGAVVSHVLYPDVFAPEYM